MTPEDREGIRATLPTWQGLDDTPLMPSSTADPAYGGREHRWIAGVPGLVRDLLDALEAAESEVARLREGAMRAASYVVTWHPPAEPADDDDGGEFSHCALCHADADGRVPDSGPWHEPTCICYVPPQEPTATPRASP